MGRIFRNIVIPDVQIFVVGIVEVEPKIFEVRKLGKAVEHSP
jgi:hypothetical protein